LGWLDAHDDAFTKVEVVQILGKPHNSGVSRWIGIESLLTLIVDQVLRLHLPSCS